MDVQENFSSQGRESFGREQGSRGAQRDVLSTGVAEGDQTINAWISQARKLIPTQGKGKKPQIQKGNTPSCCPLQCHEQCLCLFSTTKHFQTSPAFHVGVWRQKWESGTGVMGTFWHLQPRVTSSRGSHPATS